jgi:hypothetical protein
MPLINGTNAALGLPAVASYIGVTATNFQAGNIDEATLMQITQLALAQRANNARGFDLGKFLQHVVFKGLFAKLVFFCIATQKLAKYGSLGIAGSVLAGIVGGDLFVRAEHSINNSINSFIDPAYTPREENKHLFWSLRHLLAQTLSVVILSCLGVGKKLYTLKESLHAENPDPVEHLMRKGLANAVNSFGRHNGYSSKEITQTIQSANLLTVLDESGNWFNNIKSRSFLGGLSAKGLGFTSKYLLGCPNWNNALREGQNKAAVSKAVWKDATMKIGLFTVGGLALEYFAHFLHYLFRQQVVNNEA